MVNPGDVVINTIALGSLYALLAIGFTLIFGIGGIFNLAHGAVLALGGFTAYFVSFRWGYSIYLGMLAAVLVTGVLGGAFYYGVVEPIEDNVVAVLIMTLLAGFVIQFVFGIFVTKQTISVPQFAPGSEEIAGYTIQYNAIFVFIATWILIGALYYLINRTNTGRAILAVSMSDKGASLVGIDHRRINLIVWVIASMFAGFAGVLLTSYQTGGWNMGLLPLLISFSIVILGGLGSIKGSVVAAYLVGFVEVFTTTAIDPELTGVMPLLLLVIVLLVRPQGLFGRGVAKDV